MRAQLELNYHWLSVDQVIDICRKACSFDTQASYSERRTFSIEGEVVRTAWSLTFPSSAITFFVDSGLPRIETVVVSGLRGSVQDCIVWILEELNIPLEGWDVSTTRPDIPWYVRTPENKGLTS